MLEEAHELVLAIEAGRVGVRATGDEPQDVYAGDVEYETSNGWRVVVFNDCNEWDYFDAFTAPDGRTIGFDQIWDWDGSLRAYTPTDAWALWGIPGYLQSNPEKWTGWQTHLFDATAPPSEP